MDMDLEALEALVARGRRAAGTAAALAEALSGRAFDETEETKALLRVLYEDVPLAISAEKTAEQAFVRIAGEAERSADSAALHQASEQLRETETLALEALADVERDLRRLETLAR